MIMAVSLSTLGMELMCKWYHNGVWSYPHGILTCLFPVSTRSVTDVASQNANEALCTLNISKYYLFIYVDGVAGGSILVVKIRATLAHLGSSRGWKDWKDSLPWLGWLDSWCFSPRYELLLAFLLMSMIHDCISARCEIVGPPMVLTNNVEPKVSRMMKLQHILLLAKVDRLPPTWHGAMPQIVQKGSGGGMSRTLVKDTTWSVPSLYR